jgi:hypothetical protein
VWAGFAASATLGALTATLVAGSDDQPNPTATTQQAAGQLSDEVRRMITSYLDEEGYRPDSSPEEADATEPDVEDPDLPVEPPVPVEPPLPVAPVVAVVPRTAPAAKAAGPGAGPWPIDVVPDVLPRVEVAIGSASLDLPPVVRPEPVEATADVPVALLQTLDAPAPAADPVELLWRPDAREPAAAPEPLASPEPASPSAQPVVLGAPEPVEPAEPVVAATSAPSDEPVSVRPHPAPEVVEPAAPAPSAELRVDHAAKSAESAKHGKPESEPEPDDPGSRHAGGNEVGEQVTGDADVLVLPAGER